MNERRARVAALCDGVRSSRQIAELTGETRKYVQGVFLALDLPRRRRGSATGAMNAAYKSGRRLDRDGYILVSAPEGHPYARMTKGRHIGIIYEHRLLMEQELGRYLLPTETVDHIDGLRLHNSPENLRLFDSNSDHLRETITGNVPNWSAEGIQKMNTPRALQKALPPVNTYLRMKRSGDARLRQILLAALSLGIDSPYLLGSSHHLTKAGISDFSRSNLERELALLYQRYE